MEITPSSATGRFRILGPFGAFLQFSGFDLNPNVGLVRKSISFFLFFLFCIAVIVNIVVLITTTSKPVLSILWMDHAFTIAMLAFALTAAIALGVWTYSGFIPQFQERLAAVQANRSPMKNESRRIVFGRCWFLLFYTGANWIMWETKGFLMNVVPKHENYTVTYKLSKLNLYGADYLLVFFIILATVLAPAVFTIICDYMSKELSYFNQKLLKAGEANELANQETLNVYSSHHFDLICLVKFANTKLKFLTAVAPGCNEVAYFLAMVITTADYKEEMRTYYLLAFMTWLGTNPFLHLHILEPAGRVQSEIHRTVEILMTDASLQTSTDESIRSTTRMMVDRCTKMNTCLAVFGFFRIDQNFLNKVMILTMLFGNSFAFLKTFYDQGHPDQPQNILTNYKIYG